MPSPTSNTPLARVVPLLLVLALPGRVNAQTQPPAPPPETAPATTTQAQAPPAPETRAEALRREREAKQQRLEPYGPNGLERTMNLMEKKVMPLLARDGLYARLGSLTTGSGFAYGGGFRNRRLFSRHGSGDIWAAASLKHYWTIEGRLSATPNPNGVFTVEGFARRVNYPQEEFFGSGPASLRPFRSDYKLSGTMAGGRATVKPAGIFSAGGGAEFLSLTLDRGTAATLPAVQDLFNDTTAPGLARQPDFIHTSAFAEIDYRQPLNARKGGWYRADVSHYGDRSDGEFSFRKIQVEVRQYASVLAERRVFAVRGWLATTDVDPGRRIPFYLLPSLGGNDTLRGFRPLRFRGPHAMLMQAEYRFEIWAGLDGAVFYDTGKVADRRADLNFKALERDYGFGFRFNTDAGVIMRVDAAFGSRDGRHLHIVFGTLF